MPDAFRIVQCDPSDLCINISAMFDTDSGEWRFQELWALMFGYSSGVTNFNRWSKFLEAITRRVGCVLWTMNYDDGSLRDLRSAKGACQKLVNIISGRRGRRCQTPSARSLLIGPSSRAWTTMSAMRSSREVSLCGFGRA